MLDFYFINDNQTSPNYPNQDLELAGSLDAKTFDNLIRKGMIDSRLDYYSDFRWSETLVKQIRQTIEDKQFYSDTDGEKLLLLMDTAISRQSGLIAYGD
ncbi:hypothetical protein [Fluviicola sp.]|uniref:hypothetical protein n=1 Tax=Fluviicola sp. TaxID=1917219 RepID=UPI002615FDDA|nr:hypothetical protein [Fluviicola sp.]